MIRKRKQIPIIGWREWVALPDLGIKTIKAKIDTGARSSALHAYDVEEFQRKGRAFVRFKARPVQRTNQTVVEAEAEVLEYRSVRSSSGKAEIRPVIITHVLLMGHKWLAELTLTNRDEMGFRMLLGREALRKRFLVDAGKSFYGGKPKARNKKRA